MTGQSDQPSEVTELLARLGAGESAAMQELFPIIYGELRQRAHRQLARRLGSTLETTGLVHEAYLKLSATRSPHWNDRNHFLAVASRAMRQILVDAARRRMADKRGTAIAPVSLDPGRVPAPERSAELVALDEALIGLAQLDQRLARTVELRFFGGLSVDETAAVLGTSPRTVKRDWQKARALLYRAMADDEVRGEK